MNQITIAYGMTETSPVSCQTRSDDDVPRGRTPAATSSTED